ncbi:putative cell division control protein [Emericellopsis atlantica]|uniref:Cell division control protein n=1 Tax=Emericellopsis atlantica TaxID=2614577 RepID=A0A9P7ZGM1_9HYPO|nr:putative cell division control protein [Emericellopsis atlantica]KAG9251312.1 putative cell division control protein [Emericellopsis atlantica]
MPAATAEAPAVSMSFANNFWGKDDAGVGPLLERMQGAKQTCDELRSFYASRASIEEEYARKLLSLTRKALGSQETGSLKTSLDTLRGEVEQMGKQHQSIAAQMKTELEEPLAAFAGGMKERRKIVQSTVEKLLKTKIQQTQQVNKTRDRFEQDCLKIKGYLAQGHMVMGQEERRNKAKLEKTQISVASTNTEYESAVKILEETTARWNREWKAAADKFQDLEEERLDFTKSSLWTFANIASTVCVSDDASCEKVRLSLEKMDVEKDIVSFIKEAGTGQEIPDAPRYINFCRGDVNDNVSDYSDDENYQVAQFSRTINPAFRSSSPQPSTFESHHDPNSPLANKLAHREPVNPSSRENVAGTQMQPQAAQPAAVPTQLEDPYRGLPVQATAQPPAPAPVQAQPPARPLDHQLQRQPEPAQRGYDASQHGPVAAVPHDPYPQDGMTMLCRTGPVGPPSDRSSQLTSNRPSSRDENSEYSNPTSLSSYDPASGAPSPTKQEPVSVPEPGPEKRIFKKKSGFFQNHSPFRRKSVKDVHPPALVNRNTWHPAPAQNATSPVRRPQMYANDGSTAQSRSFGQERGPSPEPIDANASVALGVGQNVLPVETGRKQASASKPAADENDPIAQALAELKGVTLGKQSSVRMSADHYHGIATPAPGTEAASSRSIPNVGGRSTATPTRSDPPPSYQQPAQQTPVSRLGVPAPAVTSKAMKEATKKATNQARSVYGDSGRGDRGGFSASPSSRPATRGNDMPRAASPAPTRSASPQPQRHDPGRRDYHTPSPKPYSGRQSQGSTYGGESGRNSGDYYRQASPNDTGRGESPAPRRNTYQQPQQQQQQQRPQSSYSGSNMAVQLAPAGEQAYGSQRGRGSGRPESRAMGLYDGDTRQRSKSVADPARQYTSDGRPILHYARAMYMYQAAIPEELGFNKGDYLAILRHQDDGWWEAELHGGNGRIGLVPSNYVDPC